MASGFQTPNRRYKVGRVLDEYGLLELHEELGELWCGTAEESLSLRDLAEKINVALVRRTLEEAGDEPLDGEAENVYRLLTDDEVSAGVRTQQRNQLERDGVDVEQLERDFVTHQSVYTYLTEALGISKPDESDQVAVEKYEQRIQRLRSRTEAVTESSLTALEKSDQLSLGSFDVTVDLRVFCEDCGTQYKLSELLREGACDCH